MSRIAKLVDTSYTPPRPLVTVDYDKNTIQVTQLGEQALILPENPLTSGALQHPIEGRFVMPGQEGYAELFAAYVLLSLMPSHKEWVWEESST